MLKVKTTAPTRIDLAGGTLDIWPLHQLLEHKATVNLAVAVPASVEIEVGHDAQFSIDSRDQKVAFSGTYTEILTRGELPLFTSLLKTLWNRKLPGLKIVTTAQSPAGAGLGGSSALAVAFAAGLCRVRSLIDKYQELSETRLVETCKDVESAIIRAPTGVQDYWAAVRGGINLIYFPPGKTRIITLHPSRLPGIADDLILVYSGQSRASAMNNWKVFRSAFEGDKRVLQKLNEIGTIASACAESVLNGDTAKCLQLSQKEWNVRRDLWPQIVTPETQKIENAAAKAGAYFSRVCGAGGGGVMAVFAHRDKRRAVCDAVAGAGGILMDTGVAQQGLDAEVSS